jgi:putative sugar O-methyltransferase
MPRKRTSISDLPYFLNGINTALRNEDAFRAFKRLPGIEAIEGVPPAQGEQYRAIVLQQTPALIDHWSKFRENDLCGNPRTAEYPEGPMSPTTWRYIKVLSDLQMLFGDLTGWDVAEIGAGYGGQYKIIQDVYTPGSYTIYDLPAVMKLIVKYLEHVGCPSLQRVRNADFHKLPEEPPRTYDLVLSNWALSECTREVQDLYIEHVLRRSRRGYVTYNQISHHVGIDSYRKHEFLAALGFPVEIMAEGLDLEIPEDMEQFILYWHDQPLLDGGASV